MSRAVIVASAAAQRCFELAQRVATTDVSVLIAGESGTGKEVVARFIHDHSRRAQGAFIAINCAAIPEQMLEAMLFGHERGAFTGAHQMREGKFELAHGGTLLLIRQGLLPERCPPA
jgi:two-component system response regulator FlrC